VQFANRPPAGPELEAVVLATLAGASFGALAVAVRWGLGRCADPELGALAAAVVGVVFSASAAAPSLAAQGIDIGQVWPYLAAGLIAPGASQILLTLAVRDGGPSRAAIYMGAAPLMSITIALTLLGEPFSPLLAVGTVLIVLGGIALAGERTRLGHSRVRGAALALLCAALFAARDNIARWTAGRDHPQPLIAATTSLLAAAALILIYLVLARRDRLRTDLLSALPAFVPAGLTLAIGYDTLLAAFDHGRVSVVSPLNATGSLWAVVLGALVIGRSESIASRTLVAALLVVAGGALIGALR
jgi:drug/metabolite transporter (DMT)-like permease